MGYLRSFLILTKPRIVFSVAFTGLAGIVLAERGFPDLSTVILSLLALVLSASAAALLNNIMDRQIDQKMNRLGQRVKALDVIGERMGFAMAMLFIFISLFLAGWFFNVIYMVMLMVAILSYTPLYTLYLKRSSPYGTILGGIPGAMPVLAGYSSIDPALSTGAWILFAIMMVWQPPHFWALAQVYKNEYQSAGIPVMPVAFGSKYTNVLIMIYSLSLLPITLALWFFGHCSEYYAIVAIVSGAYFDYVMFKSVRTNAGYGKAFGMSILYILIIMGAIIIDVALNPTGLV